MTEQVPARHELSFFIGEIVRNDVVLETEMRALWRQLRAVGLAEDEMQRNLGRTISQVRKMVREQAVPLAFRDLALEVVDLAADAHRERSVLAHDQWMQLPYRPDEVSSMRRPNSRRPLEELGQCAADLLRIAWRTRALWIIAPYWVGGDLSDHTSPDDLHSWTRVAMGHIADDERMVFGTLGEAPHPPGGFPPAA